MDANYESSCDEMEDDEDETCIEQALNTSMQEQATYFAQQLSSSEYDKQARDYTNAAVNALVSSPDYQRVYTRCRLCWCSWSEGQYSQSCAECGGFAMARPCPVCQGRCDAVWTRDVDLSHSNMEAYWDGECHLPANERHGFMAQMLISNIQNEDEILNDFGELSAQ